MIQRTHRRPRLKSALHMAEDTCCGYRPRVDCGWPKVYREGNWCTDVNAGPSVSNKRDIYCKSSAARGAINITNTISCCFSAAYASVLLLRRKREWRKEKRESKMGQSMDFFALKIHCQQCRVCVCLDRRDDRRIFIYLFLQTSRFYLWYRHWMVNLGSLVFSSHIVLPIHAKHEVIITPSF